MTSSQPTVIQQYLEQSNISHLYDILVENDVHDFNTLVFLNESSLSDLCGELNLKGIEKIKFISTIKRMQHERLLTSQQIILNNNKKQSGLSKIEN